MLPACMSTFCVILLAKHLRYLWMDVDEQLCGSRYWTEE